MWAGQERLHDLRRTPRAIGLHLLTFEDDIDEVQAAVAPRCGNGFLRRVGGGFGARELLADGLQVEGGGRRGPDDIAVGLGPAWTRFERLGQLGIGLGEIGCNGAFRLGDGRDHDDRAEGRLVVPGVLPPLLLLEQLRCERGAAVWKRIGSGDRCRVLRLDRLDALACGDGIELDGALGAALVFTQLLRAIAERAADLVERDLLAAHLHGFGGDSHEIRADPRKQTKRNQRQNELFEVPLEWIDALHR